MREVVLLAERDRVKLFELLRQDLAGTVAPDPADAVNTRRKDALTAYAAVAMHLDLDDEGRRALTMREFDEASQATQSGWTAKQVAAAFYDSWPLAKQAALGERLSVDVDQKWRRKSEARHVRTHARYATGLIEWLDTDPDELTQASYDAWRKERNDNLVEGEPPFVGAARIRQVCTGRFADIAQRVRDGLPIFEEAPTEEASGTDQDQPGIDLDDIELASPSAYVHDPELLARRVNEGRLARGWTKAELGRRAGLDASHISIIEGGKRREVTFIVVSRLAKGLDLSIEYFLTDDGGAGLP